MVHVWHPAGGRDLRTFAGHDGPVTALAFAAGGKLLSVSDDGTALVWDTSGAETGRERAAGEDRRGSRLGGPGRRRPGQGVRDDRPARRVARGGGRLCCASG